MSITSLDNHLHRFCGGRYRQDVERVTIRLSGMQATVERGVYRCAKCADEQRTIEQREAAERLAVERMRDEHGLLTPREIRQLREGLGVTAAQLGELLYGVPRGVVEGWERGRYLQNREADALLRTLRDPAVRERRAARAGVTLPDPVAAAAAKGGDALTVGDAGGRTTAPAGEPGVASPGPRG